jgi:hypothetical protein
LANAGPTTPASAFLVFSSTRRTLSGKLMGAVSDFFCAATEQAEKIKEMSTYILILFTEVKTLKFGNNG